MISCTLNACFLVLLTINFQYCVCEEEERKLYEMILQKQDEVTLLSRPVWDYRKPINVTIGVTLQQIIDIKWLDHNLRWNPADYGGITTIRLPPDIMWKPDVLLYNSVDKSFDSSYASNAVVHSDGSLEWIPPGIVKASCKIDISNFPFDDQRCPMKFGSWTYSGNMLNLQIGVVDLSTYTQNGEWSLMDLESQRNELNYHCCPEPYIDVTFTLWVRRRTLYYTLNWIMPCLLMSLMTLLGFTLPPDSGERLSLEISIFMSMIMFMLMVAETMPPTSESVPLIGMYFLSLMVSVALAVTCTVIVVNLYHRSPVTHCMNRPLRVLLLNWLPWLLLMERPGFMDTYFCEIRRQRNRKQQVARRLEDDLVCYVPQFEEMFIEVPLRKWSLRKRESTTQFYPQPFVVALVPAVRRILDDLQFIVARMKKEDNETEIVNDWQFAAMVIDRLSFVLFTSILILSTCGVLFSAPHLVA